MNLYSLLCDKSIIEILDGDKKFGEIECDEYRGNIDISMPYLSGPVLCQLSNRFGLPTTYNANGIVKSRWVYLSDLIQYCIEKNKMSELLTFLFSKEQFSGVLKNYTPSTIEYAHKEIVSKIIDQINSILYFGGHELSYISERYIVKEIGNSVKIQTNSIKTIDREYISELSNRALKDIDDNNYDSSLTKARTLLEEVFCYVIEQKGEKPSESGEINRLYTQVKDLYNMHANKDLDVRINMLLSGLEKILTAITQMRNVVSDSHGVGAKRININEHHARLFVNSSVTMAEFILSVCEKAN